VKRLVSSPTVAWFRIGNCALRMFLVAAGLIGFGEMICETERGRPLGISVGIARDSRRVDDDEGFLECLVEEEELPLDGTSRIFKLWPVVGSVV
jgi:hypothetical protein